MFLCSSRRRHTRWPRDWSSDVCSSDLNDLITAGEKVYHVPFNGEASLQEIERVSEIGRKEGTTVVIGLGGGKTIDAAKAIGEDRKSVVRERGESEERGVT